jgi:hypothetical protein
MTRITRNKNKQFRKKSLLRRRNTRKKYNKRTSRKNGGGAGCSTMKYVSLPETLKKWDGAHFGTLFWSVPVMETKLRRRTIHSSWGERLYVLLGEFFDGKCKFSKEYEINKADKELYLEFYSDKKDWLAKEWYISIGGPYVMLEELTEGENHKLSNTSEVYNFFAWLTHSTFHSKESYTTLFGEGETEIKAPNPCEYESSRTDV